MHFTQRNLRQDITYWAPPADQSTNEFGHATVANGVLIKGRWEDKVQQIVKDSGEEVTSMAEVYVDRDVAVQGFLKLGDFHNQVVESDAAEIQTVRQTPDLRNLGTEIRAYL